MPAQPRLGVQHNAPAAPLDVIGLDSLLQDALGIGLDGGVDGQGQIAAVLCVHILGVTVVHLHAGAGAGGDHPATVPSSTSL